MRSDGLLPYYLAALMPATPINAVKVVMGLGWLLGGVGMFLWLRSWLGQAGALVAGLVYVYQPFQITTVYVRGAWGEALFWGLLPWAILAVTYLVTQPRLYLVPIAAAFWLGLGLSQLGLTVIAFLFLAILLLVVHRPQAVLPLGAAGLGTALTIGLYALLPGSLWQPPLTPLTDHFLYPAQLFSAQWGFGISRPGWNDGLSLSLGLAGLGLAGLTVWLWQRGTSPVSRRDRRLLFFLSAGLGISLLQFQLTTFLWLGLSPLLTYPWQLLGLAGLSLSALAGAAFWLDSQLARLPLLAAIVLVIILPVYDTLLPRFVQPEPAWLDPPSAVLGRDQLALLDYGFSVKTSNQTAGLALGQTTLPLALHGPLQPHDQLVLNVTWQPLQPISQDLKVFVHLIDPQGTTLAQFDGQPQAGSYRTSQWTPGDLIIDTYPVELPASAPSGPYWVHLGLYAEETFARLPVSGNTEGRVVISVE